MHNGVVKESFILNVMTSLQCECIRKYHVYKAFSFRKELLTECRILEMIDIAVVTVSFVVDVVFLIVAEGFSCATNYSKQVKHMIACIYFN